MSAFKNAEHIINTTSYQSLCDHRPDVLSFLFRQMACRKKENITTPSIEPSPASPTLIPCPRAFTFGDSPFKNNSMLTAASGLSLTSEVSKQQQQNQSLSISSFSLSLQTLSTNSESAIIQKNFDIRQM
ncbi:hypothetical protein ACTXT7_008818 [Hymenolepis weldensis]